MKRFFSLIFLFISLNAIAEMVDTFEFHNQADRVRAVELAKSLRCPQCQNQNLVESNSPIAYDLRIEVYKMVNQGKTNQQIIDAMTARFGNFVNYKPPFQWNTALLWLLPAALLLMAFALIWCSSRTASAIEPEKHAEKTLHFDRVQEKSAVKFELKSTFTVFVLLFAIPLLYYFSLDRFNRVQQGEQEHIEQLNRRVETTETHKTEDIIGKIQDKLRQDPNNGENWIKLGDAYMQNNEFDYALIAYSNASKIEGDKPMILGLAATALYMQADQQITPQVQQLLNDALRQDPKEVSALSLLAAEALKTRDYSTALNYWQQILDARNSAVDRRAIIQKMKMAEFLQRGTLQ